MKRYIGLLLLFSLVMVYRTQSQTIEEIVATLDIDTLLNNGPKDNRINFAIANLTNEEGTYTYESSEELNTDIEVLLAYMDIDHPEQKSGFSHYSSFFNIYSVYFPDPLVFETTPEFYTTYKAIRDTLFLPWQYEDYGWATMLYSFKGGGGGGTGVDRDARVGDIQQYGLDIHTTFHEFNHTLPGNGDEYTASGGYSNYVPAEAPNLTGASLYDEIPWRKWIDPDLPLPTPYDQDYTDDIGLFLGNISGYFGSYRPTAKGCYMGAGGFGDNYGQDLCSVCLQRFVCMIYQYVNVIENPIPESQNITIDGNERITFSADILSPEPNTQKFKWLVNGIPYAEDVESIDVDFDVCNNYTVELIVTDETEFVRYDEKFKDIYPEPKQSRVWTIDQSSVNEYDLSINTTTTNAGCTGASNGSVLVEATGGTGPYQIYLDGEQVSNSITELSTGTYSIVVADENGCSVDQEIEVGQDPVFDFAICSSSFGDLWNLSIWQAAEGDEAVEDDDVEFLWSTGAQTSGIQVSEGTYSLTITSAMGCQVTREITLQEVSNPLVVESTLSHATNYESDGGVFLKISGGIEPYEIVWYEAILSDQTSAIEDQVIASGSTNGHNPIDAFDNSEEYTNFWAEGFTGSNYIGFDFEENVTIDAYSITSNNDVKERDAKSWVFQGSDDATNWSDIDEMTNFEFPEREQRFEFNLTESATYRYFRIQITENWGDGWLAIREVEFGKLVFEEMFQFKNDIEATELPSNIYKYHFNDQNKSCSEAIIAIENYTVSTIPVEIEQEGSYEVKIVDPVTGYSYYWSGSSDMTDLLHEGTTFQPEWPGQFFVQAYENSSLTFASNVKGFAVTMPDEPEVVESGGVLEVADPEPGYEYIWYDQALSGVVLHSGSTYTPENDGYYFVATRRPEPAIDPIDPATIAGITFWMDASDIDADGETDDAMESSNRYSWTLKEGGEWGESEWFVYLANYQNGLGVEDRGSVWLKSTTPGVNHLRTVILAYEESYLSVTETAPFDGLSETIPKHSDASQLFSSSAPTATLDGKTYLNGEEVDPLTTENPMDFIVLSTVFSELQIKTVRQTDPEWEGKLGELIIWDLELTEDQIFGVNEFLRQKWLSAADLESTRVKVSWGSSPMDDLDQDGFNELEDCNDNNPDVNPAAIEICDGLDNNCDGVIDEGFQTTYYVDSDGDGFGDTNITISSCEESSWYVSDNTDCLDTNTDVNANQIETPYNGLDDDCNTETPDDDLDGDGFLLSDDCDDTNADVNPNIVEVPYNGLDDDCNSETLDDDFDGDGFVLADDCDDTNPNINPNIVEVPYNGLDDDCNGETLDDDFDGDGFALADDCDDTNPNINPNIVEVPYNGLDDDCNTETPDDDLDGDGFLLADDCNDTNADVNPNIVEVPYNGLDDDCNTETPDDDLDGDGFLLADDCDDTNAGINIDQQDIPDNDIDENCDGIFLVTGNNGEVLDEIRLFPNPASDILYLEVPAGTNYNVYLYDLSGSILLQKKNIAELEIEDIQRGIYMLVISFSESTKSKVCKTIMID